MYTYFFLSSIFNALASSFLGLLVYFKNKKNDVNKYFALLCLGFAMWAFPYVMWPLSSDKESVKFWFQLLHYGAIYIPIAYFHFVLVWTNIKDKKKYFLAVGYCLAIFFSLFVFSPWFIADMEPKFNMKWWAIPGKLYYFYLIYFFFFYFYSSFLLYFGFKKSQGEKRQQIKLLLIGLVIAIAGGSTNYFLWFDINIPPYGNIFALSHVILGSYAIIVYRMMDIRVVARKYLVYIFSLALVVFLALSIKVALDKYLPIYDYIVDLLIIILAALFFPLVKKYLYYLANKYFFSSLYDPQKLIADLGNKLGSALSVEVISESVYKTLDDAFHFQGFAVLFYNKKDHAYSIFFNKGFEVGDKKKFECDHYLLERFVKKNKIIALKDIIHDYKNETKQKVDYFVNLSVENIVPLNVKNEQIGLLWLGKKETGALYCKDDIRVLHIISTQVALAFENAFHYKEILGFNTRLKDEVRKATMQLFKANEKLKRLDTAKSEFISIASHQLRTPLTIIKGYIAMLLEGDYGPITETAKLPLQNVAVSNNRLIRLVENLLSVSRIESGRMIYEFEYSDFNDIVVSVYSELKPKAQEKNLIFDFKAGDNILPKIKIDSDKIREVVMNLVDNAIKYTPKGRVDVLVSDVGHKIRFCIKDSGIGIDINEMPGLFKKFSRGSKISLVHTEGTGLGLYVAKKIIEAHKGKIWAKSEGANQGSLFCFELPLG